MKEKVVTMPKIDFVDTTLRDGHQCLWATRMTTEMMLPIAEKLDSAGFRAIELMGVVHFDACLRYLHEDPWERIRLMKSHIKSTPLQAFIRSGCVLGFDLCPDDLNELWVETLIENGIDRLVGFDGLHDFDNVAPYLNHAKKHGATTIAWLIYSVSPVHTDELYIEKAKEIIKRANVDEIVIQDTSGVLTPERAGTLIPALKAVIGDIRLGLHGHSLVGLSQRTYLEAVKCGVDNVYTCISPIADGNAPPSIQTSLKNFRHMGYETDMSDTDIAEISSHFEDIATLAGHSFGEAQDFDAAQFHHQIPGGVLSNLASQLKALGIPEKIDEVLNECGRVREDLGWPIQVTPFMVVQATLNLIKGERYSVVPDEVKKYALGYFGKHLAPVEPNALDRIVERGSQSIALSRPKLAPVVPSLKKRFPQASKEELLLRYAFPEEMVNNLGKKIDADGGLSTVTLPLAHLVNELINTRRKPFVFVQNGNFQLKAEQNRSEVAGSVK